MYWCFVQRNLIVRWKYKKKANVFSWIKPTFLALVMVLFCRNRAGSNWEKGGFVVFLGPKMVFGNAGRAQRNWGTAANFVLVQYIEPSPKFWSYSKLVVLQWSPYKGFAPGSFWNWATQLTTSLRICQMADFLLKAHGKYECNCELRLSDRTWTLVQAKLNPEGFWAHFGLIL